MRLNKIKLAGFKSFVDPTTIVLPYNRAAIVGPNGCGKSNVIDAVRWVMGESSAKTLRGESMDDVIFKGSSTRKPVSQASVELIFDNSDATIGGEYASYSEISIRRRLADGHSQYYLNNVKCRRKDIMDVFYGTGLGARSYSIIEQGMISRVIEAKPEELRAYLEEAAGISKYKERRRETENRIRHTRENLERLTDLREEIDKQLERLKRQAKAAERYGEYKQDERLMKGQLSTLQWQRYNEQLKEHDKAIKQLEIDNEASMAELRSIDASIEQQRELRHELSEALDAVQRRFYQLGTEVSSLEQNIVHQQQRKKVIQDDLSQVTQSIVEVQEQVQEDDDTSRELTSELTGLHPALESTKELTNQSKVLLAEQEQQMQRWQSQWDQCNHQSAESSRQVQVEQTRIRHQEENIMQLQARQQKLQQEIKSIDIAPIETNLLELTRQAAGAEEKQRGIRDALKTIGEELSVLQKAFHQQQTELDDARKRYQQAKGRLASLETLQEAALGKRQTQLQDWLSQHNLSDNPRLGQALTVDTGWEKAAETVLEQQLQAICIDNIEDVAPLLADLADGGISMVANYSSASRTGPHVAERLSDKISSEWQIDSLLEGIYVAEDLNTGIFLLEQINADESIITKCGVWLGKGWLRIKSSDDEKSGVIQREQELKALNTLLECEGQQIAQLEQQVSTLRLNREQLEQQRDTYHEELATMTSEHSDFSSQVRVQQNRLQQTKQREEQITQELTEISEQMISKQDAINAAKQTMQQAEEQAAKHLSSKALLQQQRETIIQSLAAAREQVRHDQDKLHQLDLRIQSCQTQLEGIKQNKSRVETQLFTLSRRKEDLTQQLSECDEPIDKLKAALQIALAERLKVDESLTIARQQAGDAEQLLNQHEKNRIEMSERLDKLRSQLEKSRLDSQELSVRRKTIEEQLQEADHELEKLIEQMPEDATIEQWQSDIVAIEQRITRLGPINLAAIDEFNSQSERKVYLDEQDVDLTKALTTLENAIRKIDNETKQRFKTTFEKVNDSFKDLFPRVFGGGKASLTLIGDDLLNTGLTVMAQPPGKRNSSIHLLSGGEKALTAVALVFAIFQLNPSPFCILDEVDAPLDDANVLRYCKLVEEMSKTIQFIFISHNKIAIEMADNLVGVTMSEPGVSRMVAVDLEEAVALADA